MNTAITVEVRETYGCPRVYPACDTARAFTRLTGTKTFSAANLDTIRLLGYKITVAANGQLPDGYGQADKILVPQPWPWAEGEGLEGAVG